MTRSMEATANDRFKGSGTSVTSHTAKASHRLRLPAVPLLEDRTVYENLQIPLSYRNIPRAERAAIVADTLDRLNMVGKLACV
jgi:ABC-type lipoprotein export system ATPase subunit